jgi:hypothetical protein
MATNNSTTRCSKIGDIFMQKFFRRAQPTFELLKEIQAIIMANLNQR